MVNRRSEDEQDVAGAIFGQILVTSLVAALSEDDHLGAGEIFVSVLVTMIVYWLAHVYAESVSARLAAPDAFSRRALGRIMRHEWPMLESAAPPLAALALGWIGVLSRDTAVDVAIILGVAALVGWGFLIARRARLSPLGTIGSVMLSGGFGLVIVALRAAVH